MSKVFTVNVSFDYVIAAEDEDEANEIAKYYAKEALGDLGSYELECSVQEATKLSDVTRIGYASESYVYGDSEEARTKTVGELLSQ